MEKILILAEKPDQARKYAGALGGFTTREGYMEKQGFYITWCFGHLIELERDTAYRDTTSWSRDYLPLLPKEFKYGVEKTSEGKENQAKKNQLKVIKALMEKSSSIINGTDPDREGELIFLYVYNYLKCKLPYKRLWVSSLTESEIKKAFNNLKYKQGDDFLDNLGKSSYARATTDWLVGVNATQSVTLQIGRGNKLTIGRVQTAILKIICERFLKNKNHKKQFSYRILTAHNYEEQTFVTASPIFKEKSEVEQIVQSLKKEHTFVEKTTLIDEKKPPLLHTLDSLTIVANAKFGYSSQVVLKSAQTLYENRLISYPRTEDPYINQEAYDLLKTYLPKLAQNYLSVHSFSFPKQTPESVNGQMIKGSHDALIPTGETANYEKLSKEEKIIYALIVSRCLESFSTSMFIERTYYDFENNEIIFGCDSKKIIDEGWKKYSYTKNIKSTDDDDDQEETENILNLSFEKGQKLAIQSKEFIEIATKPPSIYTDGLLTKDLTNIGKFLQEENPELLKTLKKEIDLKDIQLGTKATRPIIMEKLKNVGFIEFKGKKILPTEKGLKFYEVIKDMQVANIAYTAILEKNLKDIAEGKLSQADYYQSLYKYVQYIVKDIFSIEVDLKFNDKETENFGVCPKCKQGKIVEGKKGYGCNRFKQGCDFVLWKTIAGKELTEKNVRDLMEKGITSKIKGLTSTKGKFEAKIKLNDNCQTEFVFGD